MDSGPVTACALCGSDDLRVILDLGEQPLAERFDGDPARYPLAVAECGSCTLAQLTYAVDQAEVFPAAHPYATGNSGALRLHFAALAHQLSLHLNPGDLVADIGANDGTLLREFSGGFRRVAVEPTGQAGKMAGTEISVSREFFTAATARRLAREHGRAQVITACNVLAHIPDPHDFAHGVNLLLAADGVFVAEVHDLSSVVRGLQTDTVYHEHRFFWSAATLGRLLEAHHLEVTSVQPVATHGGSLRVTARHKAETTSLHARADAAAADLHGLLAGLHGDGNLIYGIGATTRAVPLIHFAGIAEFLACVCEVAASEKIGKTMPGTGIPVVDEAKLIADQPPYALLLSWHMAGVIVPSLRRLGYNGRFIVPLPEPKVIDG